MSQEPFPKPPDGDGAPLEPEEEASQAALEVAEEVFRALSAGEGRALWDLFSDTAQAFIINLGHERGMDFDLASRLRSGVATTDEFDVFLGDLLSGIRRDMAGVDFSRLALESKAEPEAPMQVRVHYLVQLGPQTQDLLTAIPAGSIILSLQRDRWKIERLVPRPERELPEDGPAPGPT